MRYFGFSVFWLSDGDGCFGGISGRPRSTQPTRVLLFYQTHVYTKGVLLIQNFQLFIKLTFLREIQYYRTPNGRQPFTEWFESIEDKRTQQRIDKRLARLEDGNLGDCESVGDGIFELRLHFGPGYRIYFGQIENTLVLLLCGGDKPHSSGMLNARKPIGEHTRRHINERNGELARVSN